MSQFEREVSYLIIAIGVAVGVLIDAFTPLGTSIRSALHNIGFAPLWARAISAALIVGASLVVALRGEVIIRRWRAPH